MNYSYNPNESERDKNKKKKRERSFTSEYELSSIDIISEKRIQFFIIIY